jgi:hypothetical protein
MSIRYFVVRPDDMFERWSQARLNRVWDGDEAIPEFAGGRLRYALVFVETKERKVVGVRGAEWNVLAMDATGRHNKDGPYERHHGGCGRGPIAVHEPDRGCAKDLL